MSGHLGVRFNLRVTVVFLAYFSFVAWYTGGQNSGLVSQRISASVFC
jgi:hypothetical protein